MEELKTRFAPAARVPIEQIIEEYQVIRQIKYIQEILDALPYIGAILNKERQVIYSNQTLLTLLGINSIEPILGKRPGEVIHCVHSNKTPGGCGTTENCQVCGAVRAILTCQTTQELSTEECRITSVLEGKTTYFDLLVTAKPVNIQGNTFYVLTLTDISSEKRKKALERIFFHDVLNMAGSLNGFFSLLKETNDLSEYKELLDLAREVSHHLTDEVQAQRHLVAAETGDLEVHMQKCSANESITEAISSISLNSVALSRNIETIHGSEDCIFFADKLLLRRILVNLLKNALEAGEGKDEVRFDFLKSNSHVRFRVWNESVIPENIQMQIFQRSFSSKGTNRGIGTYSVKLLTEQYLGGSVGFDSQPGKGTTFYIELPVEKEFQ